MGLFDYLGGLLGWGDRSPDGGGWADGEARDVPGASGDYTAVAESFAAETAGYEFDFTVASLARLDEYVTELDTTDVENDTAPDDPAEGPALRLGCYFGEVLVRQFDAEWVRGDEVRVVVSAGATSVAVSPFQVASVSLRGETQFARTGEQLAERVDGTADEDPGFELAIGESGDVRDTPDTSDGGDTDSADTETTQGVSLDVGADSAASTDDSDRFPSVDLEAETDLETAHDRALATFEEAGYHVTAGDLLNTMPENPVEGVGKLFLFYSATEMFTGVVYVGDWGASDTEAVVSLAQYLRVDEDLDGLHVVSTHEPPAAVTYFTATHPRAAFALDARRDVKAAPAFSPASAPAYADLGADLLARHADLRVDRTDVETLARLDAFVLDVLRLAAPDEQTDGFVPREALLVVGALAGEVIRHGLERSLPVTVTWETDEEISSTGVVLAVTTDEADGTLTINPVGKAFKLFRSGEAERLADLYETCVQTIDRAVGDADAERTDGRQN
jgi:hypothetical protein